MTPATAAELARILCRADPPAAPEPPVRLCAWNGCDGQPLVRREDELPHVFARRRCCRTEHAHKRTGELAVGDVHHNGPRRKG